MTPAQLRAARAYLNWSQADLANRAGVTELTISNVEGAKTEASTKTLKALERVLGERLRFLPNGGFEPKQETIKVYRGQPGFQEFMTDVYETCRDVGGNVYVNNSDELLFDRWMGEDFEKIYAKNMRAIPQGHFWFHVIAPEDSKYLPIPHGEYRWIPKEFYSPAPTYIYGNKIASILFLKDDVIVRVYDQKDFVESQIKQFLFIWSHANAFE